MQYTARAAYTYSKYRKQCRKQCRKQKTDCTADKESYQILCTANTASNAYSSCTEDTESIAKVQYISQHSRYGRKTAGTTTKQIQYRKFCRYMYTCILHTISARTEGAAIIIIF
jgi:hypothetical protein